VKRTILMIGAGIEQVPGIETAHRMGLRVVTADGNPQAPGFKHADDRLVASTYDIEKTMAFASEYNKKKRIDGVITVGADVPLTVASVAHELGLPGISLEAARLASDKLAMKDRFAACGVPIPWFREVKSPAELKDVATEMGFPLVLKPVDSRGARGVLRLTKGVDLVWAFETALKHSPYQRVMVEEFLAGPQLSTESLVYDGQVFTPGFTDRNYELLEKLSPYIIENGGQMPSILPQAEREKVEKLIASAAAAMGIERGIVKGDIVVTEEGPKVIELAARLSGGWFATDQIPLSTGVNLVKEAINIALGEEPDFEKLKPAYHRGVAIRYLFPLPGKVKEVTGLEGVLKLPWVERAMVTIKAGDVIDQITDHTRRVGFVIVSAPDREIAVRRAEKAIKLINIEVEAAQ